MWIHSSKGEFYTSKDAETLEKHPRLPDQRRLWLVIALAYPLTSKFTMDTSQINMIIPQEILALLSLRKVPELALVTASFPDSHVVSPHPRVGGASRQCSSPIPTGCWEAAVPDQGLDASLAPVLGSSLSQHSSGFLISWPSFFPKVQQNVCRGGPCH